MKKYAILLIILFSCNAFAFQQRLDDSGIDRVSDHYDDIRTSAMRNDIPEWFLAGVLYNESNARHKAVGDGGRAYGMGQIHCGNGGFSWLKFLTNYGFKSCDELMNPARNIEATAIIISHLRLKLKDRNNFLLLATFYHQGENFRKRGKSKSRRYFDRVKWFGSKIIENKYQVCFRA